MGSMEAPPEKEIVRSVCTSAEETQVPVPAVGAPVGLSTSPTAHYCKEGPLSPISTPSTIATRYTYNDKQPNQFKYSKAKNCGAIQRVFC